MNGHITEGEIGEIVAADDTGSLAEVGAHWSLFLPAILVAIIYGVAWLLLDFGGHGEGALGRLIFLVLVAAPPLLWGHAFLRFYSTGAAVTQNHVVVARGWPHHEAIRIALSEIESATMRVSWLARMLGAGSIHLRLWDGSEIDVYDLERPDRVVEIIREHIRLQTG